MNIYMEFNRQCVIEMYGNLFPLQDEKNSDFFNLTILTFLVCVCVCVWGGGGSTKIKKHNCEFFSEFRVYISQFWLIFFEFSVYTLQILTFFLRILGLQCISHYWLFKSDF